MMSCATCSHDKVVLYKRHQALVEVFRSLVGLYFEITKVQKTGSGRP